MVQEQIDNLITHAISNELTPSYLIHQATQGNIKYSIPQLDKYFEAFPHIVRQRVLKQMAEVKILAVDNKTQKVLANQKI